MNDQEILEFVSTLPSAEGYTQNDRYQDFKQLFNTDQGKRVLRELLAWGKLFRPSVYGNPIDPYRMAINDGEANFARKILVTLNQEPPNKPEKTTQKRNK